MFKLRREKTTDLLTNLHISLGLILLSASSLQAQEANYLAPTATGVIQGDANFDFVVNEADADAFAIALVSAQAYESQFGVSPLFKLDTDHNLIVDVDDIAGFQRLLSPERPLTPTLLIEDATLLEESVEEDLQSYEEPKVGVGKMSSDGRYVMFQGRLNVAAARVQRVLNVYDTYTQSNIKITVPPGMDFDGFYLQSFDISANGRYVALTGLKEIPDGNRDSFLIANVVETGMGIERTFFLSTVFRYDLVTGAVDSLPAFGGEELIASFQPTLSNDGNTLLYRGVRRVGEDGIEAGVFLSRFYPGSRPSTTALVARVDQNSISTAAAASPVISGDGRFALLPYTKADDVEWYKQDNRSFTGDPNPPGGFSPIDSEPVHYGLAVYDVLSDTIVKYLASGAPDYRPTYGLLDTGIVATSAFDISRNGNISAYCRQDNDVAAGTQTFAVYVYNKRLDIETLVEEFDGTTTFCPISLDLSSDGKFVVYRDKLYDVHARQFRDPSVPAGLGDSAVFGEISDDACHLTMSTGRNSSGYIIRNSLNRCYRPPTR